MTLASLTASLALAATLPPPEQCTGSGPDVAEICAVLEAQQAAWNSGDIYGFMQGYWQSDEMRFASGGAVTTGWEETLQRYLTRYDSRAAMGELAFTGVEVDQVSAGAAVVFGHWQLFREHDAPRGLFTLVFREIDGSWVIVHDHTSSE
ncbi:DUF4440 domain-containing protein [Marinicauda algicola]|uniref:DUF4440 domain-containing protein n=1 Tax=Marinicauda algicola TaxID=2029849 RepID=A0A4S2H2A5_9PROT|nr:nuclear transport factor 2 family protein [Marinicauda algicola]TGY89654.1 DUF4440 domain-containing protein [Marinicauda algicola]